MTGGGAPVAASGAGAEDPAIAPPGEAPRQDGAPKARPRTSALLVASVTLSVAAALLALTRPPGLGPVGPFAAGVLAFLGYRNVRASGGALRGPALARVAMSAALLLFVHQAWLVVAGADVGAARVELRRRIEEVEAVLRTGTAENAWDLLAPDARAGLDRDAWVRDLRAAQGRAGALRELGVPVETGGDAGAATDAFRARGDAEATFLLVFAPSFERGIGRLELVLRARKRDGRVGAAVTAIRLSPP